MHIVYRSSYRVYKRILKDINNYWYNECPFGESKKPNGLHTIFSCDQYTLSINRYSISIWVADSLKDEEKREINRVFDIILTDKKHNERKFKFFLTDVLQWEEWLLEMLKKYENVHIEQARIFSINGISIEDIQECIDFVEKLEVNGEGEKIKKTLIDILCVAKIN